LSINLLAAACVFKCHLHDRVETLQTLAMSLQFSSVQFVRCEQCFRTMLVLRHQS